MAESTLERKGSSTAGYTCFSRACATREADERFHGPDDMAEIFLPLFATVILNVPFLRRTFIHKIAPSGIYEYVIARTKYIDAAFQGALTEGCEQVLLFGAGFDTRALRFEAQAPGARIFELDAPPTQRAKRQQYQKRGLAVPTNLVFVPIDFEKESLPDRLDAAGFEKGRQSLFVLEGVLMYLEPESVWATFETIAAYAGPRSRLIFDYVRASVLRQEETLYGEEGAVETVSQAGARWRFGIDPAEVGPFLERYGFEVSDHKYAPALEREYFTEDDGRVVGRINGTHCLVTGERQSL